MVRTRGARISAKKVSCFWLLSTGTQADCFIAERYGAEPIKVLVKLRHGEEHQGPMDLKKGSDREHEIRRLLSEITGQLPNVAQASSDLGKLRMLFRSQ